MNPSGQSVRGTARREFLQQCSAAAVASGIALATTVASAEDRPDAAPLPTVQLGQYRVSRLIAGWNPIGGLCTVSPSFVGCDNTCLNACFA